jgi:hypothetical protein
LNIKDISGGLSTSVVKCFVMILTGYFGYTRRFQVCSSHIDVVGCHSTSDGGILSRLIRCLEVPLFLFAGELLSSLH